VISTYCPKTVWWRQLWFSSFRVSSKQNKQNLDRNHKLCSQWLSWRYHVECFMVVMVNC